MSERATEVSLVLEWETALEGDPARGAACLDSVRAEVARQPSCETVICFDPAQAGEHDVRAALGGDWPGPLILAPAPERLDYYGKKNHGFTHTRGEIVVFVDSDVVPEAGWLRSLVASFEDFRASCVMGRTHLETSTRYERAVALFWIFDARDPSSALRRTRRLVSNNIAFRRALFKHMPFPERPTYRGQCSELAWMLEARGIPMHEQPGARAAHPAPDGLRGFLGRALHAGADQSYYDALAGRTGWAQPARTWRADLQSVLERSAERAPLIGASRADLLAARLLGAAYYSAKALGSVAARLRRTRAQPA